MIFADCYSFFNSWCRHQFSCCEIMMNFPEDPWITDSSATDHDAIHSVTIFILECFLRTVNIAISKDGYMNSRIAFYPGNKCPVSFAFIHLTTRTSVNCQGLYAYILQPLGYFFYVFRIIVPP